MPRSSARRADDAAAPTAVRGHRWPWVPIALVLFAVVAYGPSLDVPFLGDGYVFLDKTRTAGFGELWSRANTDFGWYRPWSRELHFWALQGLFGPHEIGFRAVNLALWGLTLGLYWSLLRRLAGCRVASWATFGLASLSLWGAPLTWVSGAQDLWMLLFAVLALILHGSGRLPWSLFAFALALLSKETAAVVPLVIFSHARAIERRGWRASAVRALPYAALSLVWLSAHPVLLHRLVHAPHPGSGEAQLPPGMIALLSLASLANLDRLGLRVDPDAWRPAATVFGALLLATGAWFAVHPRRTEHEPTAAVPRGNLVAFGAAWCAAGWLPLLSPSIGWHAYYGSFGALGGWLAIGVGLERIPRVAAALLFGLGILRGVVAATPSWDWGSEWYQTRAGNMLRVIRTQLMESHPTLPAHTRLYFGSIPNNIGLIAGRSPAVRVWYGDSTLEAGFYSWYRPRGTEEPAGMDLFFHFDSTAGLRAVRPDSPPPPGLPAGSAWELDHESLAVALLTGGDPARAAMCFERIAELPHRPDALMLAGTCWSVTGEDTRASLRFEAARRATGATPREIEQWAARLRETMPAPRAKAH